MQKISAVHKCSGIYQIVNLHNGKFYVGQAQNIANRIREHQRKRNGLSGHNPYSLLYRAVAKYGWDGFEWFVIEQVDDVSQLDEREKFWIDAFNACRGYNICAEPHTTRGWQHKEGTKAILSELAHKRTGILNSFYGKKHSESTKARIGTVNAARLRTPWEKAKLKAARAISGAGKPIRSVDQIDLASGKIVQTWSSISEAAKASGTTQATITMVCQGYRGRKSTAGWGWKYSSAPWSLI